MVNNLTSVLEQVEATPNATLRTFDVYNKPKPHSLAIDTRNGKLIRGSELLTSVNEYGLLPESDFDGWPLESGDFDGTVAEMQNQRQR